MSGIREAQLAKQIPATKKNVLTAIRAAREKGMVLANMQAKITLQQNFHYVFTLFNPLIFAAR
jgi:hypothetical protein